MRRTATIVAMSMGIVGAVAAPAHASGCGADTGCLEPRAGHTGVYIRTGPGTSYTPLGQLNAGQTVDCWGYAPCGETSLVVGQRVTGCGWTSSYWWVVRYNGRKAYTSFTCIGQGG